MPTERDAGALAPPAAAASAGRAAVERAQPFRRMGMTSEVSATVRLRDKSTSPRGPVAAPFPGARRFTTAPVTVGGVIIGGAGVPVPETAGSDIGSMGRGFPRRTRAAAIRANSLAKSSLRRTRKSRSSSGRMVMWDPTPALDVADAAAPEADAAEADAKAPTRPSGENGKARCMLAVWWNIRVAIILKC